MSIVSLKAWRDRRAAEQLAQALSGDPLVRAAARIRDMARLIRREKAASGQTPAEVVTQGALEQARQRARERAEQAGRRATRRGTQEND